MWQEGRGMKRQVATMGGYCRTTRGECDAIFHCKMFCAFANSSGHCHAIERTRVDNKERGFWDATCWLWFIGTGKGWRVAVKFCLALWYDVMWCDEYKYCCGFGSFGWLSWVSRMGCVGRSLSAIGQVHWFPCAQLVCFYLFIWSCIPSY